MIPSATAAESAYIPRAEGGARVAHLLARGMGPLILTGPPGVGCSTELAAAERALAPGLVAVRVRVDELVDPADFTAQRLLFTIGRLLVEQWATAEPPAATQPTPQLVKDIRASDPDFPQGNGRTLRADELLRRVLEELQAAQSRPLALLVDGLDHAAPERAREAALACFALASHAAIALVLSPEATHGPDSFELLREARLVPLDPVDPSTEGGLGFLREIAARAFGLDGEASQGAWISALAAHSGGLPGLFVGLVRDTLGYADGGPVTPAHVDLAGADHAEAMRRLLLAGDLAALAEAAGQSGTEVPADRRARLLDQGLLLERREGLTLRAQPHPLLVPWLPGAATGKKPSAKRRKA